MVTQLPDQQRFVNLSWTLKNTSYNVCNDVDQEGEDEGPKTVKTSFTIRLTKFDDTKKVPLIKEVKNIVEGMNLVQVRVVHESRVTINESECRPRSSWSPRRRS